jgi:DNA-binding PucR family transcriptional regulator
MFRKQRLEEILGISLDEFSSRMAVATAVHLMKLRDENKD